MTGRWSVPYCFIMFVSTGIADLPTGAPCRADEGVRPYRGGDTPAKNLSHTNKSLSGGRGRPPLHNLSQVSASIADLPTAARRRADEERPYLFLLNITPSTATQQLTAYNGAEKQYSTPLRLFSPPPADDKPLLLRKKCIKLILCRIYSIKRAFMHKIKLFQNFFEFLCKNS